MIQKLITMKVTKTSQMNADQTSDEDIEEVEIDDDFEVEVMVDGKQQAVSIGALKRLAGQEKSLTRKSQEVAAKRKEADEADNKSQVIFDKLIKQAEERYKPYQDIDMLVASRSMETEDFAQLRKEAQQDKDDLTFLKEEADSYLGEMARQQQQALQAQAQECVKVLQDEIPEWSNELYNDIRTYAIQQGLPERQVNTYVDSVVIQVLHKSSLMLTRESRSPQLRRNRRLRRRCFVLRKHPLMKQASARSIGPRCVRSFATQGM